MDVALDGSSLQLIQYANLLQKVDFNSLRSQIRFLFASARRVLGTRCLLSHPDLHTLNPRPQILLFCLFFASRSTVRLGLGWNRLNQRAKHMGRLVAHVSGGI